MDKKTKLPESVRVEHTDPEDEKRLDMIAVETHKMLKPELTAMADSVKEKLPVGWGFGLLIFELSDKPGAPLLWISNANREDMLNAMTEFIDRNNHLTT